MPAEVLRVVDGDDVEPALAAERRVQNILRREPRGQRR